MGGCFPGVVLVVKKVLASAGDVRDVGLIPGSGRSTGEGNGYLVQYSCLENPMDRGAWRATVHGVAKSQTQLMWLSMHACMHAGRLKYLLSAAVIPFAVDLTVRSWVSHCISMLSEKMTWSLQKPPPPPLKKIYLAAPGLNFGMWDLVPWPEIKPGSPPLGE